MATIIQLFEKRLNPPRIMLCDPRSVVTRAWGKYQDLKLPNLHIYHGEFGDWAQNTDALVVPSNRSGLIPKEFVDYFGDPILERYLCSAIRNKYSGKFNVGQAVLIATHNPLFPYLICAPVMRSNRVQGNEPTNAYLAMRAILELWRFGRFHRRFIRRMVKSIAVPFLAPESGSFSVDAVAKEQLRAVHEFHAVCSRSQHRHPHLSLVTDLNTP